MIVIVFRFYCVVNYIFSFLDKDKKFFILWWRFRGKYLIYVGISSVRFVLYVVYYIFIIVVSFL